MKRIIFFFLVIISILGCSGSGVDGTWKGYELGGGVPPSSWYIDISGERFNAIHLLASGEKENYNGTIKLSSSDNGVNKYSVFINFGRGIGMDYILKYATDKDRYFSLYDNSSDAKFQATMELDGISGGGIIYLER